MDWLTGIQGAINYVEENLSEEISYQEVAKRAGCSSFYFQKLFTILCGITLGEYIRNRRMTLAGAELSKSDCKVIDVAMKYGYESPESFTRAFSKFHGITPTEAKRDGRELKYFFPLSVKIALAGGGLINYKIVEKPAFDIIEKLEVQSNENNESLRTIQEFWERSERDGTVEMLLRGSEEKGAIFGICYANFARFKYFDYSIAAKWSEEKPLPEGFKRSRIPKRTWAVFECRGAIPDAMEREWQRVVSEFFPTSCYEPTYEMDIEFYPEGNRKDENYRSEIWVPVKKRED